MRRSTRSRTAIRSVTSVVFDTNKPNHLFSSGSADGVVKQWDLRRSMHRRVNPPAAAVSPDFGLARSKVARSHGITSMALAPDGATLYALSISNRIFALDALNIANPEPVRVFSAASKDSPHRVTDVCRLPSFRADSFYVRLALSCNENGRYIMAGSSDGSIWMWDTLSKDSMSETSLPGYRAEVSGLDTAWEQIAACSDDVSAFFLASLCAFKTDPMACRPLLASGGPTSSIVHTTISADASITAARSIHTLEKSQNKADTLKHSASFSSYIPHRTLGIHCRHHRSLHQSRHLTDNFLDIAFYAGG